jgi:hypothetical protein
MHNTGLDARLLRAKARLSARARLNLVMIATDV